MALENGFEVGAGFPPDSRSFLFPLDNSCLSGSHPEAFGTGLEHADVDDSCTGKGPKIQLWVMARLHARGSEIQL